MRTLALVVLGTLAGCGGASRPTASPTSAPPTSEAQPAPAPDAPPAATPTSARFPGIPAGPAGDQLAWLLDLLVNKAGKVDTAEIEQHFHATFLAQVPAAQVAPLFAQLGAQAKDLTIVEVKPTDANGLVARVQAGGEKMRVIIHVDAAALHRIDGLLFQPDVTATPPASFEEAERQLTALAPKARMLVAEVVKGTCKPIREVAPRAELAIGSTFKLYVLLALVDQILAGKLAWTDEIAVRDAWKSLPSGVTQNDAAGTKLTVQTLAERMISISDNTATDHLLFSVGRDRVEAAVRTSKHAAPALDVPFISTREMFVLKLGMSDDERDRYLALSPAKRRTFLDKTVAAAPLPELSAAASWKGARAIDRLEWFASGEDLCRVMATLAQRAKQPKGAPLRSVLSKNPGLPIDKKVWPFIGFKGGSEPGVMDLTYWLERDDGRTFVVTVAVNADAGGTIDEGKTAMLVAGVIDLLGKAR
ncbi:MAG: serine hydrolase [Kofleriaceae bacterium]|nr:serine hydrolase [Kofleriaceae bacterium]